MQEIYYGNIHPLMMYSVLDNDAVIDKIKIKKMSFSTKHVKTSSMYQ